MECTGWRKDDGVDVEVIGIHMSSLMEILITKWRNGCGTYTSCQVELQLRRKWPTPNCCSVQMMDFIMLGNFWRRRTSEYHADRMLLVLLIGP